MPSPVGHVLVGLAAAWVTTPAKDPSPALSRDAWTRVTIACAVLALGPDLDVVLATHRAAWHSITGAALVATLAGVLARLTRLPVVQTVLACGLAWSSHILLDWLGHDRSVPQGVMAFWPFSRTYFISGLGVFADVSRRYWILDEVLWGNLRAVARELVILGPLAAAAFWWSRSRRLSDRALSRKP